MNKLRLIEISNKLLSFHREISELYSDFAKSQGLTFSGFMVLNIIWNESDCTQSTIIKKSCLPKQTVNTIIKGFIKQGIVKNLKELKTDKRNKIIKFTEYGKEFTDKIMLKVQDVECSALNKIGEEKARILVKIINDYKNNIQFS